MLNDLMAYLQGKKTYATVALTAVVCVCLYVSGADAPTISMVAMSGLLGGTATLRDAVAKGAVTKEELAAEIMKQAIATSPQGGDPEAE